MMLIKGACSRDRERQSAQRKHPAREPAPPQGLATTPAVWLLVQLIVPTLSNPTQPLPKLPPGLTKPYADSHGVPVGSCNTQSRQHCCH